MELLPFDPDCFQAFKKFTDQWIGKEYYSIQDLEQIYDWSRYEELNASWGAWENNQLIGVRLCFAPGKWIHSETRGVTPSKWLCDQSDVGYFKSLFIHGDHQKKGLGKKLSLKAMEVLKMMGAKAVLCHSWLESPGNSSQRYLNSMGFQEVERHLRFWHPIDYECTRCAPERCQCTASEMIYYFNKDEV